MRLRVRDASSGRTWRVQLDQITPTFEDLENALISHCYSSEENPSNGGQRVLVSLNKKDPIHSDPAATLNRMGLCNGDLVYILSPTPSLATQPPATIPSAEPTIVTDPGSSRKQQQQEEQPMDIDPNQDPSPSSPSSSHQLNESDSYAPIPVPVGLRIPGYLLRVLSSKPTHDDDSSFLKLGPPGMLILMVHAAMLETGFSYVNSSHNAVDSGSQNDGNDEEDAENLKYRLSSATTAISSGMYRLQYNLAGAAAATKTEEQNEVLTPACTLICSAMGDSLLIAASAQDGKHSRHVVLNWRAQGYFVPYNSKDTKEKERKEEGQETEGLKLCDNVEITPRQEIILRSCENGKEKEDEENPKEWKLGHEALKKVWNRLKDSIALPMLTAACVSAGYPPPAGLLTLPTEVKNSLLCMLSAIDLSCLGATCTELRHLTSSDELWKPLFLAEFPNPPVEIADAVLSKGYKWAYAHCFIEKRRLEEESRRRRQRRYIIPGLPLGPRPPYYPAPAPRGFPGIIGGDQDRLPFFPGPPGRFAFGGSGGGHGFGSGGGGGSRRWL